jgi:hypothetical protein
MVASAGTPAHPAWAAGMGTHHPEAERAVLLAGAERVAAPPRLQVQAFQGKAASAGRHDRRVRVA